MFDLIKRNFLKSVMLADGAISLAAGIVLSIDAQPIAGLLGPLFAAKAVLAIGVFLIAWGVFHLAAARTPTLPAGAVWSAIVGDALWVVASAILLIVDRDNLSLFGIVAIAVLAVGIADIMLLKVIGLRGGSSIAAA
jgi:uncharacterized membrane protein HdeD (DUF308 family)